MRTLERRQFGDRVRNVRLRWFRHVQRRDSRTKDVEGGAGRQEKKGTKMWCGERRQSEGWCERRGCKGKGW